MVAADAVARMNRKMRVKMAPEVQDRLATAILASGAQDDLMFRNTPVRNRPSSWTPSGFLARLVLTWRRLRGETISANDRAAALSETHYAVRRSGASALLVTVLIGLFIGLLNWHLVPEALFQAARDSVRPIEARGDIVVIAQDDRSAQRFGKWPWPRRNEAALADKLREMNAKTILFHQVFADPTNAVDDNLFAAALARANGKIWLSSFNETNSISGKIEPVVPLRIFRDKSRQTNGFVYGITGATRYTQMIGGKRLPASAVALAGIASREWAPDTTLRPDTAIQIGSFPVYSMAAILDGEVPQSAIAGKSVVIGLTMAGSRDTLPILGQSMTAPSVYRAAIAAETLKNGGLPDLGWLSPLLASALIGLGVIRSRRTTRTIILAGGTAGMIVAMLVTDRMGLHFDMIPAFIILGGLIIREASKRRQKFDDVTVNSVSGLPTLGELHYAKGRENCAVVSLKIEYFSGTIGRLTYARQRELIHGIAGRIAILCPESIVHQGDDGLFVWLLHNHDEAMLPGQLLALFMVDVSDGVETHKLDVSIGKCADLSMKFDARLAVAIDRAQMPAHITLREVR